MKKNWSDGRHKQIDEEEIKRVRALWDEGYSAGIIGRLVGRTKNSIIGMAHRNGFPSRQLAVMSGPKWTDEENDILESSLERGLDDYAIARLLPERSAASVAARRYRVGLRLGEEVRRRNSMTGTIANQALSRLKKSKNNIQRVHPVQTSVVRREPQPSMPLTAPFYDLTCEVIRYEDRPPDGCLWLIGHGRPWMVCAAKRVAGLSYCAGHYHLSIKQSSPPTEPEEAPSPVMEMAA